MKKYKLQSYLNNKSKRRNKDETKKEMKTRDEDGTKDKKIIVN